MADWLDDSALDELFGEFMLRRRFFRVSGICGVITAALLHGAPQAAVQAAAPAISVKPLVLVPIPPAAQVHPASWPKVKWPLAPVPADELRIKALLAKMTVEEKVGQVVQPDIASVTPEDMRKYHFGSILNGGNSAPGNDEFAPPQVWLALADQFYDASVDRSDGGVGIPMIWGTDAVHGHSNIVGATLFPHNIGLGAARDPDLIERIGRATALEVRTTGMEWTFAPTVTVPQDYRWGRAYEGYSPNADLVASYAAAMIRGLQGPPVSTAMLAGPNVLASTKHFLADGGTEGGRDQGDAQISEVVLRDIHAKPYGPAITAGVATVMTSFSSWNGVKIAGHHGLVTDVLKGRMNFGGFVVTDWNAHGQLPGCTTASCPQAINAGIDMYMAPDSWRALYASLVTQVRDGTVPMARLDDAVSRILRTKLRLGLFDYGKPSTRPYAGQFDQLGSAAHRAIAREAVRKSLVLLKNANAVLPLRASRRLLVAGDGVDDIARQSGGWTITWQGTGLDNSKFPGATSILAGLSQAVTAAGGTVQASPDGSFAQRPDAAIVVFGETPYAEFQGDIKTLQLKPENRGPFATLQALRAKGIPVVALFITGRPLWINPVLNTADAVVVAWLPGSEGGGIADVLVGDALGRIRSDFHGLLPAGWPATAQPRGALLYPYGYGLTMAAQQPVWKPVSADSGVPSDAPGASTLFDKGVAAPGWSLQVNGAAILPSNPLIGTRVQSAPTDYGVQEGARQFTLTAGPPVTLALDTATPVDLSRETNADILLLMTLRLDAAPTAPLMLSVQCGSTCAGSVAAPELARLAPGSWQTVGIPLKCFARAGADMSRVTSAVRITTSGAVTFSLARVALGTVFTSQIACP